jgi:hypothetical protein
MKSQGTPKTLNEAIENGINEFLQVENSEELSSGNLKKHVKNHVQDFFRNAVSPLYLLSDDLPKAQREAIEKLVKRIG